ncbi:MAG: hypothetical protein ABIF22_00310 [bacterium]
MNINIKQKLNNKNFLTGMKKLFTFISPISTYFILFGISFAATSNCNMINVHNFKDLVTNIISCFLNPIVILLVSFSIVIFIWGVFKFIKAEGDDKQAGREFMFWGIVGIFVIVSLWGLVSILQSTFTLNGNDITPRQINL